ncbi:S-adenosyl-L-methionine-dependent methyltransferase [Fistulina hepatica ATCC 64428]|uniref:S-adenosyl-L-methionine-dependent methyltransferase n=1 Tax=Fistulina hepatica ATCC 64428 TaxID=1128425 RepID=A0A0D7AMB4_9AGAR|nr:S-adenosyl-L-methionine-dependent methyltransferase [Fistulina hepatica ATCC 64428]
MSAFAKRSFDTAVYAACRPTYPNQLFQMLFKYHELGSSFNNPNNAANRSKKIPRWDLAVDLGCGTGQATLGIVSSFKRVVGVDASEKMLDGARKYITANLDKQVLDAHQIDFVASSAEDLSFLQDSSVDMVIAAQAAHWFDWNKMWPQLARVMRAGGSAAFWIYSEFRLTDYPSATAVINDYMVGTDPANSVGSYWQQPGRSILNNHLLDVPAANAVVPGAFDNWTRLFFTGPHYPTLPGNAPVILRRDTTWEGLLGYLQTFSALHVFREQHPEDAEHPDGDITVRFLKRLKDAVRTEDGGVDAGERLRIDWPLAVILVKKT